MGRTAHAREMTAVLSRWMVLTGSRARGDGAPVQYVFEDFALDPDRRELTRASDEVADRTAGFRPAALSRSEPRTGRHQG